MHNQKTELMRLLIGLIIYCLFTGSSCIARHTAAVDNSARDIGPLDSIEEVKLDGWIIVPLNDMQSSILIKSGELNFHEFMCNHFISLYQHLSDSLGRDTLNSVYRIHWSDSLFDNVFKLADVIVENNPVMGQETYIFIRVLDLTVEKWTQHSGYIEGRIEQFWMNVNPDDLICSYQQNSTEYTIWSLEGSNLISRIK